MTNDCSILAAYVFANVSSPVYNMSLFVCTSCFFRVPDLSIHFLGRPRRGGGLLRRVSWCDGDGDRDVVLLDFF